MNIIRSVGEIRRRTAQFRRQGKKIALVPTMGALHPGHVALIRAARLRSDKVIVSIFVNPIQFNDPGDYESYPRDLTRDARLAREASSDLLFVPRPKEIYPPRFGTFVEVEGVTTRWEGTARPGHFRGVATVVAKLFSIVSPDIALFGRKDYQQTVVIRKMIRDLNLPVKIVVRPTVRERDGLALSSRNARFSPEARAIAPRIYQALRLGREIFASGERSSKKIQGAIVSYLSESRSIEIDYIALCHPETLEPVDPASKGTVLLVAVRLDGIRLIDNLVLK
jgi:pantoate--beta-alanine ligase